MSSLPGDHWPPIHLHSVQLCRGGDRMECTSEMSLTWLVFLTRTATTTTTILAKTLRDALNGHSVLCRSLSVSYFSMGRSSVWSGRNRKFWGHIFHLPAKVLLYLAQARTIDRQEEENVAKLISGRHLGFSFASSYSNNHWSFFSSPLPFEPTLISNCVQRETNSPRLMDKMLSSGPRWRCSGDKRQSCKLERETDRQRMQESYGAPFVLAARKLCGLRMFTRLRLARSWVY